MNLETILQQSYATDSRQSLRSDLLQMRGFSLLTKRYYECGICHQAMSMFEIQQAHMHEAIITRGMVQKLPQEYQRLVNHPSNVVLRHAKCNHFDCRVSHEGGTGGDFQVWRAGLHLVKWQGYENVYDYVLTMSKEFTTIKRDLIRFLNFEIDMLLDYSVQEFLMDYKQKLSDGVYSPDQLYEYQRAFMYLHQPALDHMSWNENILMP